MTNTPSRERGILAAIFFGFLVVLTLLIYLPFIWQEIAAEEMQGLLEKLLATYGVPLGVIIGGIFGQQRSAEQRSATSGAFWVALGLASIWNLLLAGRFLVFAFSAEDSVAAVSQYVERIGSVSLFLVAGALSFYFSERR